MDTRLVVLLAVIALLQSLFAKKKAKEREAEAEQGLDAVPEGGGLAEGVGVPGASASGGDGAPGVGAAKVGGKRSVLAELFAEIEAQAKRDSPFPGEGLPRESAEPVRPKAAAILSSGARQQEELPSFGLPEPEPAGADRPVPATRPGARPRAPRGQPSQSRESSNWELGSAAWQPVDDPPPRPERPSSERPAEVAAAPSPPSPPSRPARQAVRAATDGGPYGLRTREGLQRIIVAREVLGPPLALRRGGQEASWQ